MTTEQYKGAILPQQATFAELYVAYNFNGTKAAIDAGYATSGAHVQATRLLKNAKVKAYIDHLSAEAAKIRKVDIDLQIQRTELLNNSDIAHYVEFDGKTVKFKPFDQLTPEQRFAIKGIKQGRNGIELTLHDKAWSMDMINKHLGVYEKDNKQRGEVQGAVAILLPDNGRGRVVPMDNTPTTEKQQ